MRGYLQATIKECRKALASHNTGLHARATAPTEQGYLWAKQLVASAANSLVADEVPVLKNPALVGRLGQVFHRMKNSIALSGPVRREYVYHLKQ